MALRIMSAAVAAAALAAAPGAAASTPGETQRTTNSVCSEAFGSVQQLPAVTYGNRFMAAVGRADGFVAGCYGDFAVIRVLRAQGLTGTRWTWVSSQSGFGYTYSTYRDGSGRQVEIAILLGDREPGGWHAVDAVRAQGSRGDLSRYADRLLQAWRAGDAAAVRSLARPGAAAALLGSDAADRGWRPEAVRFDQGETWVEYADPAGTPLSFRLIPPAALAGTSHAVVQVLLP